MRRLPYILWGLFEQERIKLAVIRTSEGNITNLAHLKQIMLVGIMVSLNCED